MSDMWGQGEAFQAEIAYRRERLQADSASWRPRQAVARHRRDPRRRDARGPRLLWRVLVWRLLRGAAVRG